MQRIKAKGEGQFLEGPVKYGQDNGLHLSHKKKTFKSYKQRTEKNSFKKVKLA